MITLPVHYIDADQDVKEEIADADAFVEADNESGPRSEALAKGIMSEKLYVLAHFVNFKSNILVSLPILDYIKLRN